MTAPEFQLHDWRWVCNALASPRFPAPHLPLVDTVIIDRGRPSLWLCLQHNGTVQSKAVGSSSSQEIYNAFAAFSLGYPRNRAHTACAVHYAVGLPQVRFSHLPLPPVVAITLGARVMGGLRLLVFGF